MQRNATKKDYQLLLFNQRVNQLLLFMQEYHLFNVLQLLTIQKLPAAPAVVDEVSPCVLEATALLSLYFQRTVDEQRKLRYSAHDLSTRTYSFHPYEIVR